MSITQLAEAVDAVFDEGVQRTERRKASTRTSIEAALEFYDFKPVEYDMIISTLGSKSLGELEDTLALVERMLDAAPIVAADPSDFSDQTAALCDECEERNSLFAALD